MILFEIFFRRINLTVVNSDQLYSPMERTKCALNAVQFCKHLCSNSNLTPSIIMSSEGNIFYLYMLIKCCYNDHVPLL